MLTIESLMTTISLCIACFSLGYFFGSKRLVSGCTPNANPGSRTRNPEHKRFVLLYAT